MKVIIVEDNKKSNRKKVNKPEYRLNLFLDWIIYMAGYAIVLLMASSLFRSIYVENFLYGFIAAILIFVFNKTLKPILVLWSLPLIGLSLGLYYFAINVIILWLVSLILGSHFNLTGVFSPIIISIFISIMNVVIENLVIKPLIERFKG